MNNKPYNSYYYWENIMRKEELNWDKPFKNMRLTRDSIFFHFVIVNCLGGFENKWTYYPNIKSLLGFIEHIFMPVAFNIKLLGKDNRDLIIPSCSLNELLEDAALDDEHENKDDILDMLDHAGKIHCLWELEDDECIFELKKFTEEFNSKWGVLGDIFFYFNVFESAGEIGDYIINAYENEGLLDVFERDSGFLRGEWEEICSTVYENEFMKRKFIDILNNLDMMI